MGTVSRPLGIDGVNSLALLLSQAPGVHWNLHSIRNEREDKFDLTAGAKHSPN